MAKVKVTDNQGVDLVRIQRFMKEAKVVLPMIQELADLAENSTLLQDAEQARKNAEESEIVHSVTNAMARDWLPKEY